MAEPAWQLEDPVEFMKRAAPELAKLGVRHFKVTYGEVTIDLEMAPAAAPAPALVALDPIVDDQDPVARAMVAPPTPDPRDDPALFGGRPPPKHRRPGDAPATKPNAEPLHE